MSFRLPDETFDILETYQLDKTDVQIAIGLSLNKLYCYNFGTCSTSLMDDSRDSDTLKPSGLSS